MGSGFWCLLGLLYVECGLLQVCWAGRNIELTEHILATYTEAMRITLPTKTTYLKFGFELITIPEFDSRTRTITATGWATYTWDDGNLAWNRADFNDTAQIKFRSDLIWLPDIKLFNGVDVDVITGSDYRAVISNTGTVLLVVPMQLRVACEITDAKEGLYRCSFKFGSWVYDGFEIDIDFYNGIERMGRELYNDLEIVKVIGVGGEKHVKYYPCCSEPYPDVTFTVDIQSG